MVDDSVSDSESTHELFTISESRTNSFQLGVTLNRVPLRMELNTGASISILNEDTYKSIQQQSYIAPLVKTSNKLRSYTGHFIQVLGITEVKARYGGKELVLPIHIVNGDGPNLMGRDWMSQFQINLNEANLVEPNSPLGEVLDKYSEVFKDELGCVKDPPVRLTVHDQAKPKFFKHRPVPYMLREKVDRELDDLQAKGIISPVQSSPWAASIVPVLKQNGKMRICGDSKLTINQAAPRKCTPSPRLRSYLLICQGGSFSLNWTRPMLICNYPYMTSPSSTSQSIRTVASSSTTVYYLVFHPPPPFFSITWRPSCKDFAMFPAT